ncbi:MAG: cytochrome c [Sedimenticolaceae bacterium]
MIGIVLLTAGSMSAPAAEGFDRARALYENHCRSCHESWAHTRDGRVVDSLDELRMRVASWSLHTGLDWTAEEIDAVTRYLDRRFYGLKP